MVDFPTHAPALPCGGGLCFSWAGWSGHLSAGESSSISSGGEGGRWNTVCGTSRARAEQVTRDGVGRSPHHTTPPNPHAHPTPHHTTTAWVQTQTRRSARAARGTRAPCGVARQAGTFWRHFLDLSYARTDAYAARRTAHIAHRTHAPAARAASWHGGSGGRRRRAAKTSFTGDVLFILRIFHAYAAPRGIGGALHAHYKHRLSSPLLRRAARDILHISSTPLSRNE